MIDSSDSAHPKDEAEQNEQFDQLQLWASWLEQAGTLSSEIFQLLQLELRLAVSDSKRLLILALLFVPMLMLTWISFSVLLAWQIYLLNLSVTQGLLACCMIQILGLAGIAMGWNYYKKSLSLPLTRQNIRQLTGGQGSDT
jgi:hypothetical protein